MAQTLVQRPVFVDPADGLETEQLLLENGTMRMRQIMDVVKGGQSQLALTYGDGDFPWAVTQIEDTQAQSIKTLTYDEDGIVTNINEDGSNTAHNTNARGLVKQVSQTFSHKNWYYDHEGHAATSEGTTGMWPPITHTTDRVGGLYERVMSGFFSVDYRYHFFNGERVAKTTVNIAGSTKYYHADERGSVRYVTDRLGAVQDSFDYMPYGGEFNTSGSSTFKFNGRRDEGYDQLRFPLRMLNKTTYHWTALDPKVLLQPAVLLTDGANPFAYCGYEPMNRTDVDGGGGAGIGKITKPPVLWHVQIQKPGSSGPTPWAAFLKLFRDASSGSSNDETAEKEGEPEGREKKKKGEKEKPEGAKVARGPNSDDVKKLYDIGMDLGKYGLKIPGMDDWVVKWGNLSGPALDPRDESVSDFIVNQQLAGFEEHHFFNKGLEPLPEPRIQYEDMFHSKAYMELDESLDLSSQLGWTDTTTVYSSAQ